MPHEGGKVSKRFSPDLPLIAVEIVKRLLFEFWGTLIFLLLGQSATVIFGGAIGAVVFGLSYIGLHACFKSVSGGHFNPYVSILSWICGYMPGGYGVGSAFLTLGYVGMQVLAGFVSSWIMLFYSSPSVAPTVPSNLVSSFAQVLLAEWLMTTSFLVIVMGTEKARGVHQSMLNSSVYQGFFLVAAIAVLSELGTGGSLNFARTLGPGVVEGDLTRFGAYALAGALSVFAAALLHMFQVSCYAFADGYFGMHSLFADVLSFNDEQCAHHKSCSRSTTKKATKSK